MSESTTALNMIQLRSALRQAALPAERQIARLRGFDVTFEIADDFDNWCGWALQSTDIVLTDEQRSSLTALRAKLDEMSSGRGDEALWTDGGLRTRPEWEDVRRDARKILEVFHWPPEDKDVPKDERVMLKEALRVAALPAEQQIASFPKGSPVAAWIAGDFFNWCGLLRYRTDFTPTDEQRSALSALDAHLNEMSERHERDPELWTDEGLRRRPEWDEVRRKARRILELIQWPLEYRDDPGEIVVRPKN